MDDRELELIKELLQITETYRKNSTWETHDMLDKEALERCFRYVTSKVAAD